METPFSNPDAWDRVVLSGAGKRVVTPGVATVTVTQAREIDRQPVPGKDGLTATHLRYKPAQITISIQVWTDAQFRALQDLVRLFRPKRGDVGTADALDIAHPLMDLNDVSSVYISEINGPTYTPLDGGALEIKLEEFWSETKGKLKTKKPAKIKKHAHKKGATSNASAQSGGASGVTGSNGIDCSQPLTPAGPSAGGAPKLRKPWAT